MYQFYVKKKKRKRKGRILVFSFVIAIATIIYFFISLNINPILRSVSEEKVRALATTAVNSAAQNIMGEGFSYSDLVVISKDKEDSISLIQVNTILVNAIARTMVLDVQALIGSLGEQGIKIPLGTLSGFAFFAGHGPNIKIKVSQIGTVTSSFESKFLSAGINQTLHTLKLYVYSKICVIIPGANREVTTLTDIILCESLIVGKIPEFYLQSLS